MNTFRRDFESVEEYRARLKRESLFDEPATVETDIGKVLEQPKVIAKPGTYYGRLAHKLGQDDEYSNAMRRRYGGEW